MPDWILGRNYEENIYVDCNLDVVELTKGQIYERIEEAILQSVYPLLNSDYGIYRSRFPRQYHTLDTHAS